MPAALRDVHTKWRKDLNSMSELKNKTIITVATTGAWPTKANNPNVPMTPEEISEDVYACWKAGAAIAGALLEKAGVQVMDIQRDSGQSTGTAFVLTGTDGSNSIVVVPGANSTCSSEYLAENAELFSKAACVLLQLEIPLESVCSAICVLACSGTSGITARSVS